MKKQSLLFIGISYWLIVTAVILTSATTRQQKTTPKPARYFLAVLKYKLVDDCIVTSDQEITTVNGESATYDGIIKGIENWIKPHKIKPGTFEIISMKEFNGKPKHWGKREKFKLPCEEYVPPITSISLLGKETLSTGTAFLISDTSKKWSTYTSTPKYLIGQGSWTDLSTYQFNNKTGQMVLRSTGEDSLGYRTVKIIKSRVEFINDTTFRYK